MEDKKMPMSQDERLDLLKFKNELSNNKDDLKTFKTVLYAIQDSQVKIESRIAQLEEQLKVMREAGTRY